MTDATMVSLGLLIRWVFHYSELYTANKKISVPTDTRVYVATYLPRFILTALASIGLYCSLPNLFTALSCVPCENHFSYLAMGYCNFEVVKYIHNYLSKKV